MIILNFSLEKINLLCKFAMNSSILFCFLLGLACSNEKKAILAEKKEISFSSEQDGKLVSIDKIFTYQVLGDRTDSVLLPNKKVKYLYFSSESNIDAVGSLFCLHHGVIQYNLNQKNIFLIGEFKKNGTTIKIDMANKPHELRVDGKELNEFVLQGWFIKSPFKIWSPELGDDDKILTLSKLTNKNFDPNEQLIPIGEKYIKYTLPKEYNADKHVVKAKGGSTPKRAINR